VHDVENRVDFDRVTDKPLGAHIVGSFNTTQVDKDGHIIPDFLYPKFIQGMKENPERRVVSINHNRENLMGEILWAGIQEDRDVTRLVGEVGLYEGVDEEEIEDLGGFSVTLVGYENIDEADWNPDYVNFEYRGFGKDYFSLHDAIERRAVPARFEVQKSAAGAFLLDAIANNPVLIIELALIAYSIHRDRKNSEEEEGPDGDTEPQIVVNGDIIVLADKGIDQFLDSLSDAIGEDIWIEPEIAEELIEAIEDEDAQVEFDVNPKFEEPSDTESVSALEEDPGDVADREE